MVKWARVVFEEEIPEDAQTEKIIDILLTSMGNWIKSLGKEPLKVIEDDVTIFKGYPVGDGAVHTTEIK